MVRKGGIMLDISKFKKAYVIFYGEVVLKQPYNWLIEKNPLWIITSHDGKSIVSFEDPNLNGLNENELFVEDDKNLFSTEEEALKEICKRNKK